MSLIHASQIGAGVAVRELVESRPTRRAGLGCAWRSALLACALAGCSPLQGPGYLWQSVSGHLELIWRAEPITTVLAKEGVEPALRGRLELVQEARAFASAELGLPDNGSYTRYVALDRPFVIWNVFAAPALSLDLLESCFPVAGCVGYRGYYHEADAQRYAQQLAAQGYDVQVAGIPAYSTLGWFDDPVPSSVLRLPDIEIVRLIFHELAHQLAYVPGDTTFNESFATVVEEVGMERWLRRCADGDGLAARRAAWVAQQERRGQFLALVRATRDRLVAVYRSTASDAEKLAAKRTILADMRTHYGGLREHWRGFAGYDRWFAQPLGNAHIASIGAYTDLVPALRRLLAEERDDLPAFYARVRQLAELPIAERRRILDASPSP